MAPDPATAQAGQPGPTSPVVSMSARIPYLSTGDKAALRRLFLTRSEAASGVVVDLLVRSGVDDGVWSNPAAFARWQLFAHVAAVLSGTASARPHQKDASLGRALHEAGYSELRLVRLTSARGPALVDQIVRAARFLAASGGAPVDLRTLHDLSFDTGDRAEAARLTIARDYFYAKHANAKDAP